MTRRVYPKTAGSGALWLTTAGRLESGGGGPSSPLTNDAQSKIAVNNVQFPATTTAGLPDEYDQYAHEPEQPVTFTYEELAGNVEEWTQTWAQELASN